MTHDASRKGFFAQMLGLIAVAGMAPRWLKAKMADQPGHSPAAAAPVTIHPEARAVARRADSL